VIDELEKTRDRKVSLKVDWTKRSEGSQFELILNASSKASTCSVCSHTLTGQHQSRMKGFERVRRREEKEGLTSNTAYAVPLDCRGCRVKALEFDCGDGRPNPSIPSV